MQSATVCLQETDTLKLSGWKWFIAGQWTVSQQLLGSIDFSGMKKDKDANWLFSTLNYRFPHVVMLQANFRNVTAALCFLTVVWVMQCECWRV